MSIKVHYVRNNVEHSFLCFKYPKIAKKWLKALKKMGATQIRIEVRP